MTKEQLDLVYEAFADVQGALRFLREAGCVPSDYQKACDSVLERGIAALNILRPPDDVERGILISFPEEEDSDEGDAGCQQK